MNLLTLKLSLMFFLEFLQANTFLLHPLLSLLFTCLLFSLTFFLCCNSCSCVLGGSGRLLLGLVLRLLLLLLLLLGLNLGLHHFHNKDADKQPI